MGAALALPVVDQNLRERDDCLSLKRCHCADEGFTWLLSILNMETGVMNYIDECLMMPAFSEQAKINMAVVSCEINML